MTIGYYNDPEVIGGSGLWSLRVITAPTVEPLTTTEAKAHLRVDGSDDDTYIDSLIQAAREYCELVTRRAFIHRTSCMYLRQIPTTDILELPQPNLSSVTHIKYYDETDTLQTLSSAAYRVDTTSLIGAVVIKDGYAWPSVIGDRNDAVQITYVHGYGAAASAVPKAVKQAMLLLIGHWFRSRESVVIGIITKELELTTDRILSAYQVPLF